MNAKPWPTPYWPDGVAHDISGFEKPLFTILDDTARNYPDQVYTVFNAGNIVRHTVGPVRGRPGLGVHKASF